MKFRHSHNNDCGPVALLNALRWFGSCCTMRMARAACCWTAENGTTLANLLKAFRSHREFKTVSKHKVSCEGIKTFLMRQDHAVVIVYKTHNRDSHATLLVGERSGMKAINIQLPAKTLGYYLERAIMVLFLSRRNEPSGISEQ